MQIFLCVGIYS